MKIIEMIGLAAIGYYVKDRIDHPKTIIRPTFLNKLGDRLLDVTQASIKSKVSDSSYKHSVPKVSYESYENYTDKLKNN